MVTRSQAVESGYSDSAISRNVCKGTWERLFPRVYRIAGSVRSFEQRVMAATLWAGDRSAASHATAAALWGLTPQSAPLHVTRPTQLGHPPRGVRAHTSALRQGEVGKLRGIPVTSPARTLLDLATTGAELLPVVEVAVTSALVTPGQIYEVLSRHHGRRGSRVLRRALDSGSLDGRWASALEREVDRLLAGSALPPYEREYPIGSFRLDFAWPRHLVGIEADGRLWHSTRADFARDRRKHNDLLDRGWRIFRVTWRDVRDHPDEVVSRLERLLRTARQRP